MNNSYYDVKTVLQLIHIPVLLSFLKGAQHYTVITGGAFARPLPMIIQFYLHCVLFWDCVIVEHFCIVAVLQDVLCNPLPLGSITSLCCHTCHYSVQNNQINLEPLIRIIIFSCPRSPSVRIYNMKSALSGGVFRVSL